MWFLAILNLAGKVAAVCVASVAVPTALALWICTDALLAYHVFLPRAQGLLRTYSRFATPRREVWLTIDDGPDPEDTPRILDLLAAHQAHATFFVIGETARSHPELIRAIAAAGHEVALHTHTHPVKSFWYASPGRVRRELDESTAVLHAAGIRPVRFRPPAGIKNLWLGAALAQRRLTCVGWGARGFERLRGRNVEMVARSIARDVAPGAILLLHEGPRVPAAIRVGAVRRVLEHLGADGYRCVIPTSEQLR